MGKNRTLRVAMCQLNLRVGDLTHNTDAILSAYSTAEAQGADVAVFPELALCGYPPQDLLLKPGFVDEVRSATSRLARGVNGRCVAVVGSVDGDPNQSTGAYETRLGMWNVALVIQNGAVTGSYRKQALPNYGVFDEKRYFNPGSDDQGIFSIAGIPVGLTICEDLWAVDGSALRNSARGASVILNLNASPFQIDKQNDREAMAADRVGVAGVPIVYVNLIGGQDELVFDGGSFVMGADRQVSARLSRFVEQVAVVDVAVEVAGDVAVDVDAAVTGAEVGPATDSNAGVAGPVPLEPLADIESGAGEVWSALTLGLRDYVEKNGFVDVGLGLSGGVDSALVAALAVDALGPERVHVVLMPSRYSSGHSITDAEELASNLGIERRTISIDKAHSAFEAMLAESFKGLGEDLTEENLQSRIRGVILMALSNKFGWMILTTGNKSESAVGYSTLYGDTAGGLAVIKDVPKLLVYELCRWRNERAGAGVQWIPESILTKAPSAELRPDQRDDQSLPPYEILDRVIAAYVEDDLGRTDIIAEGFDPDMVDRVIRLIDRAEYKRRQSPPGLKITRRSFGLERRLPITNGF
ncbi:MAG: NAD+ synthase [Microthrixaceae bacterium]